MPDKFVAHLFSTIFSNPLKIFCKAPKGFYNRNFLDEVPTKIREIGRLDKNSSWMRFHATDVHSIELPCHLSRPKPASSEPPVLRFSNNNNQSHDTNIFVSLVGQEALLKCSSRLMNQVVTEDPETLFARRLLYGSTYQHKHDVNQRSTHYARYKNGHGENF